MVEVLTQESADQLIDSIKSGYIDLESFDFGSAARAVPYDFSKPHSLSRGFINNLATLSDGFSKAASMTLSTYFRGTITVTPRGSSHLLFQEFIGMTKMLSCLGIVNLSPLRGQSVMKIDPSIVFSLVDKLMGGRGEPLGEEREFTEIESNVAQRIMKRLLDDLRIGGDRFIKLEPSVSRIENNPEFVNICAGSERVIALHFDINMGSFTGEITFCIPVSAFESVIDMFDPVDEIPERTPAEKQQDRNFLKNALRKVSLDLSVEIGKTELSLYEAKNLKKGDLIILDNNVREPVDIIVEGIRKFKGIPGHVSGKKAVRLTSVNNEGGSSDDAEGK
ncbi:MAG: flagellar motor switch protein FliM [Candidatus Krumholzibacteriota bacterium]|nr:flagellar motor switch protein FliM [Candidatus Krumholzibacteriota bacterium]